MIITSKLVVRTLVVLIGLGIFVRGIWLSFFLFSEMSTLDIINACVSFIVAGTVIAVGIIAGVMFLLNVVIPFIQDLWSGEKQLFKPFKINFKFRKK